MTSQGQGQTRGLSSYCLLVQHKPGWQACRSDARTGTLFSFFMLVCWLLCGGVSVTLCVMTRGVRGQEEACTGICNTSARCQYQDDSLHKSIGKTVPAEHATCQSTCSGAWQSTPSTQQCPCGVTVVSHQSSLASNCCRDALSTRPYLDGREQA